jgi:hypothetical protein
VRGASRINAILLVVIFLPYIFGFAAHTNIVQSGLVSADKAVRLVILYFSLIVLLMNLRQASIPRGLGIYFWPAMLIFMAQLYHYLMFDGSEGVAFLMEKETYRIAALIVIFLLCAIGGLKKPDYRLLAVSLTAMGAVTGALAIRHSLIGESERSMRFVANFLRSGTEIMDTNILGAFLNMTSMVAIAGFMTAQRRWKLAFLAALLLSQAGRFFTFSTGSFYSMVLSFFVAAILLWKYDRPSFRQFLMLSLVVVAIFSVVIFATGTFETFFYRIKISDEYVWRSSIYSRMIQYEDYARLVSNDPARVLYGFGGSWLQYSNNGLAFHNSYLRPLVNGGLPALAGFLFLWFLTLRNYMRAIRNSGNKMLAVSILMFAAFMGWSFQAATLPADASVIQWFFFIMGYALMHTVVSGETATIP